MVKYLALALLLLSCCGCAMTPHQDCVFHATSQHFDAHVSPVGGARDEGSPHRVYDRCMESKGLRGGDW